MKKEKTWGGARKNAGRKPLDEPNVQINFRVPAKKAERLKALIQNFLKRHV
jgi:hypothetical protein